MSKVKIQGNAAGTGIFTVAAPATNTDRTITLPDVDATVLTTAGGTINGSIGINVAVNTGNTLTLGRVNSVNEGGQVDLCRASDNASAWGIDVYGDTTTPSLRIIDNTAAAVRLSVDNAGRVTKPYQPSFLAKSNGSTAYSNNVTIVFQTVQHNTGSHYNSSTGRFTAPVAGKYFFYAQMLGDSSGNRTIAYMNINDSGTDAGQNVEISAYTGAYNSAQGTVIFNLAAGDFVSIKTSGTSAWYGSGSFQNFFCGYLIG